MSRLAAIDLAFLLLENQIRPMHMSSCLVLEPPTGEGKTFVSRLLKAFRAAEPGRPFNQKLTWLQGGVASWELVQPDPLYHVRHVAIPAPGTRAQLDDTLALLNAPLLDRAYPLWQCFVIEGLEHGQLALFFKLHHALIDGEGGIKLMRAALSDSPRNRKIQALWEPMGEPPKKRPVPVSRSQLQRIRSQINALPSGGIDIASGLLELGAQALKLKPQQASLPFQAPDTPFNASLTSSARYYANCEIPLDRVKAVARASGSTVNDVALTFIDDSLHKYLAEIGASVESPLVASMPLSTRVEGQESSGNQVIADMVPMGQPHASIEERLQQIHDSTDKVKDRARKMSAPMRQTYVMLLLGLTAVPELLPGVNPAPSSNVLISNMATTLPGRCPGAGYARHAYIAAQPLPEYNLCQHNGSDLPRGGEHAGSHEQPWPLHRAAAGELCGVGTGAGSGASCRQTRGAQENQTQENGSPENCSQESRGQKGGTEKAREIKDDRNQGTS
jgi:WS/DGAT/MGAT family acyltransferase